MTNQRLKRRLTWGVTNPAVAQKLADWAHASWLNEGDRYWTRFGHMLTANSILIAGVMVIIARKDPPEQSHRCAALIVAVFGFLISVENHKVIKAGSVWFTRFMDQFVILEGHYRRLACKTVRGRTLLNNPEWRDNDRAGNILGRINKIAFLLEAFWFCIVIYLIFELITDA